MARKRLRPISTNVLCIVAFLGSAVGLYCLLLGTLTQSAELFTDDSPASVSLVGQCSGEGDAGSECLQYIPRSVVRTWKNRDFLILFGIPSVDIRGRRRLRTLQRSTCWQFPHVATKSNNFTGAMLVLYVLARHPSHNFTYSLALQREAAEWHDVIALPMNEGRSSTNKKIGGGGFWGNEAEVGMSRKTFFWFELALCLFPNVSYIAKGDDDMFLRVPQYLADLRSLPRRGLYWGSTAFINSVASFQMVVGFCMTLSRDVVQQFVSYKPLQRLVRLPYSKAREADFLSLNMEHEDVMVGRALHEVKYPELTLVRESRCSFHDLRYGCRRRSLSDTSVVIHHIKSRDYMKLMRRFSNGTAATAREYRRLPRSLWFHC